MNAPSERYQREDNVVPYSSPSSAPDRELLEATSQPRLHIAMLAPPWVGRARKQRLFMDAFAFLMPIRWPEPFGMVMVEAMVAGTPVLAFPEGAAPEVVEHGVSGYLVKDGDEMAAMVDEAGRVDPLQVRRSAERFAPDRIAAGYEQAYRAAMQRREPAGVLQ